MINVLIVYNFIKKLIIVSKTPMHKTLCGSYQVTEGSFSSHRKTHICIFIIINNYQLYILVSVQSGRGCCTFIKLNLPLDNSLPPAQIAAWKTTLEFFNDNLLNQPGPG